MSELLKKIRERIEKCIPAGVSRWTYRKLKEKERALSHEKYLDSIEGDGTKTEGHLITFFGYLVKKERAKDKKQKREYEIKGKRTLDRDVSHTEGKRFLLSLPPGMTDKDMYIFNPDIDVISGSWIGKKFDSEEEAIIEAIKFPNRPRIHKVIDYVIQEKIKGPNLFELFQDLNSRIEEGNNFADRLKQALLKRTLEDLIDFRLYPIELEIPEDLIEKPKHGYKLREIFTKFNKSSYGLEAKLEAMGKRLDESSKFFFRDAGHWNALVSYLDILDRLNKVNKGGLVTGVMTNYREEEINDEDITNYIFEKLEAGELKYGDVEKAYVSSVRQIDFDQTNKLTFEGDDLFLILYSSVSNLIPKEIKEREDFYFNEIKQNKDEIESYYQDKPLRLFYRQMRLFWYFSTRKEPDRYKGEQMFHLSQAYTAAHHLVYNEDPKEVPITHIRDLQPIAELVSQMDI